MISSSMPRCPKASKTNSIPLAGGHSLISCIYQSEIFSGGGPPRLRSTVVNFKSKQTLAKMTNSNIALSPFAMQGAFVSARSASLIACGSLKCATCGREASHVCSSVSAWQEMNRSANAVEQNHVVLYSERLISSCSESRCITEARRIRNVSSRKGGRGFGMKLSYRCAVISISSLRGGDIDQKINDMCKDATMER